jgi:serine/threonine protein kinase
MARAGPPSPSLPSSTGESTPPTPEPAPPLPTRLEVPDNIGPDLSFANGYFYLNRIPYKAPSDVDETRLGGGLGWVFVLRPVKGFRGPKLVLKVPKSHGDQQALENEVAAATRFGDNPSLPKVHGTVEFSIKDQEWQDMVTNVMVMEYFGGGSLIPWLGPNSHLERAYLARAISYEEYVGANQYIEHEIVQALKAMHAKGFGHFDVKPDNVMFDDKFNVKLIDLGSVTEFGTAGVKPATTESWQSPEFKKLISEGADVGSALIAGYDAFSMGVWNASAMHAIRLGAEQERVARGEKKATDGPGFARGRRKPLAAESYLRRAKNVDPNKRTIAELAEHSFLVDPLITPERARWVLRYVSQLQIEPGQRTFKRPVTRARANATRGPRPGPKPKLKFTADELQAKKQTLKRTKPHVYEMTPPAPTHEAETVSGGGSDGSQASTPPATPWQRARPGEKQLKGIQVPTIEIHNEPTGSGTENETETVPRGGGNASRATTPPATPWQRARPGKRQKDWVPGLVPEKSGSLSYDESEWERERSSESDDESEWEREKSN